MIALIRDAVRKLAQILLYRGFLDRLAGNRCGVAVVRQRDLPGSATLLHSNQLARAFPIFDIASVRTAVSLPEFISSLPDLLVTGWIVFKRIVGHGRSPTNIV